MSETATAVKVKSKPATKPKRRSFASERSEVVSYCKISMRVLSDIDPDANASKIEVYRNILKLMGEAE